MFDNDSKVKFSGLFRKYRLLSQFNTLSSLCDALQEEGLTYDPSILSHWQNGKRQPSDRATILTLLKIFVMHGGLKNVHEANLFLSSLQRGYLTEGEVLNIFGQLRTPLVFQVPRNIDFFVGREDSLALLGKNLKGKVTLLHGISGSGKTSLAIKIANTYSHLFSDGVVWLRLDALSIYEALNHIGASFGIDITQVKNIEAKASLLRSHLHKKAVLIVLDNVENFTHIDLFLSNNPDSAIIITSIYQNNSLISKAQSVLVEPFSKEESLKLFSVILGQESVFNHTLDLLRIGKMVGYLPLAINLAALQLKNGRFTPAELCTYFEKGNISLEKYEYNGKNLFKAISLATNRIEPQLKEVLISLCIFSGEEFSLETVAKLHCKEETELKQILEDFVALNLVQRATGTRYKMHPLITQFCANQDSNKKIKYLILLSDYFTHFIEENFKIISKRHLIVSEIHIIALLIRHCIKEKLYKEAVSVWKPFSIFLWETGRWHLLDELGNQLVIIAKRTKNFHSAALFLIRERSWFHYWRGNFSEAKRTLNEGFKIAQKVNDKYLIAFSKQRMGVILTKEGHTEEAEAELTEALKIFTELNQSSHITDCYLYLGHVAKKVNNMHNALNYYLKSQETAIKIGDRKAETIANSYLGGAYFDIKNLSLSEKFYNLALTLDRVIENKPGMPFNLLGLAKIKLANSQLKESKKLLSQAKDYCFKLEMFEILPEIERLERAY